MKISAFLSFFLLGSVQARRAFVRPSTSTASIQVPPKTTSSKNMALSLPRGGAGSNNRDHAMSLYYLLTSIHGYVASAAPEVASEKKYGVDLKNEGSLGHVMMELTGFCHLGCFLLAHLTSKHKMMANIKVVAYSMLTCAYVGGRRFLKDTFAKLGFKKGYGLFAFLAPAVGAYLILTGTGNVELLTKISIALPTILGAVGVLSTDMLSKNLLGIGGVSGSDAAMVRLYSGALVHWGILAYMLFDNKSLTKAVGTAAVFQAVDLLDQYYLRKTLTAKKNIGLVAIAVWGVMGYLLLN